MFGVSANLHAMTAAQLDGAFHCFRTVVSRKIFLNGSGSSVANRSTSRERISLGKQ